MSAKDCHQFMMFQFLPDFAVLAIFAQGWVFAMQKLFLPGQWKKTVKTVAKTSKNRQKLAKSDTIN